LINLKKSTGTLLQTENVSIGKTFSPQDGPSLQLDKGPSTRNQGFNQGVQETYGQPIEYSPNNGFDSGAFNNSSMQQPMPNTMMTTQQPMLNQQPGFTQQPVAPGLGRYPVTAESSFTPGSIGSFDPSKFGLGGDN